MLLLLTLCPWRCATRFHLDKCGARTVALLISDAAQYMTAKQASFELRQESGVCTRAGAPHSACVSSVKDWPRCITPAHTQREAMATWITQWDQAFGDKAATAVAVWIFPSPAHVEEVRRILGELLQQLQGCTGEEVDRTAALLTKIACSPPKEGMPAFTIQRELC
jgi:hypothetical protein